MGAGRWKFVFGLMVCLLFFNCKHEPRLSSKNFPDKEERIKTLEKHVKFDSEVLNAEFDLFNVNGFSDNTRGIPGATSLDYKFVVKVKPEDIEKWKTETLTVPHGYEEIDWVYKLSEKITNKNWDFSLELDNSWFVKNESGDLLIIYPNEGIIFKRIIQN